MLFYGRRREGRALVEASEAKHGITINKHEWGGKVEPIEGSGDVSAFHSLVGYFNSNNTNQL